MGEGREIRGTDSSLGQAIQGVDFTRPSILVFLEVDGVSRIDGGVLVKEVVGLQEEAQTVLFGIERQNPRTTESSEAKGESPQ